MPATITNHGSIHPHTRGVNLARFFSSSCAFDSSPHSWGQLRLWVLLVILGRFIPTLVGSIYFEWLLLFSWAIHPHTRGVNTSNHQSVLLDFDSSPHSWGQCQPDSRHGQGQRFIPTLVGSMLIYRTSKTTVPIHPHTRGVNSVSDIHETHFKALKAKFVPLSFHDTSFT